MYQVTEGIKLWFNRQFLLQITFFFLCRSKRTFPVSYFLVQNVIVCSKSAVRNGSGRSKFSLHVFFTIILSFCSSACVLNLGESRMLFCFGTDLRKCIEFALLLVTL